MDKSAISIPKFLYELICRRGCMKIQINEKVREFVNDISETFMARNKE